MSNWCEFRNKIEGLWELVFHKDRLEEPHKIAEREVETRFQGLMKSSVDSFKAMDEGDALTRTLNEALQQSRILILRNRNGAHR